MLIEEFGIEMTENLYKEADYMSGIAEKLLQEGIEQGAEQVTALYKELIDSGRVDDMYKAINDIEYRKELLKERYKK